MSILGVSVLGTSVLGMRGPGREPGGWVGGRRPRGTMTHVSERVDPELVDPERVDRVALLVRALLLSVVTVLLGTASHLAIGGAGPGLAACILLGAISLVAALSALRRPAGARRIVAIVVGGQLAVHLGLGLAAGYLGAGGARLAALPTSGELALPTYQGRRLGSLQDAHDIATGHVHLAGSGITQLQPAAADHAPLLIAHVLAAVLAGLALAFGERCLWALISLLAPLSAPLARALRRHLLVATGLLAGLARLPRPVRPARSVARPWSRAQLILLRSAQRRGPPAVLSAA